MILKDKKIIVTGGAGFLGSEVVRNLMEKRNVPKENIFIPRSKYYDLRTEGGIINLFSSPCDVVIHLAANCGGIGYNMENPGSLFYDNIMLGVPLMEEARKCGIKKFVAIGTVCAYPKFTDVPFKEGDLWNGYPEETNAPYGLAKKMSLVQSQAYRQQYGFNSIFLLPVNLYGPNDHFDPNHSHVIPALIRKFVEARATDKKIVEIWGTGNASREFLYVEDAAEGIVLATEKYDKPEPVNIGSGFEIKINKLVDIIIKLTNYQGEIKWNSSKPDGQPRRCLDISKAYEEFGFKAKTDFIEGLRKTVEWYEIWKKS